MLRWKLSVASLFLAAGCVQPAPSRSLEDANQAYDRAVEAEAERYSPDSLALASRALENAVAEVERQSRRPALVRDYRRARSLLGQAFYLAQGARYEALARRDALRVDTEAILAEAGRDLDALERELPTLSSDEVPEWEAWVRRYREASHALAEARVAYAEGDFADARARAMRIVEELRDTGTEKPAS